MRTGLLYLTSGCYTWAPDFTFFVVKDSAVEQITWTDDFSVGVAHLDRQHKGLIQILNRLIAESQATTGSEIVSETLNDMMRYTQEHFEAEEILFRQYDYPHLEEHTAQHNAFLRKTAELCMDTVRNVQTVPDALLHYLSNWLVEHILHSDRAYKEFFQECGLE